MRLTYPLPKAEDNGRKSLFNLVEIMWHTTLPLLFLFISMEYNWFFSIFILFSLFRLRPEREDM